MSEAVLLALSLLPSLATSLGVVAAVELSRATAIQEFADDGL